MRKFFIATVVALSIFLWGNVLISFPLPSPTNFAYQSFDDIPSDVASALIYIEDRRFFFHPWIDVIALSRALIYNLIWFLRLDASSKITIEWASTIDQQLIKLSEKAFNRWLLQKVKEQLFALNLQFHHSKNQIFTNYINNVLFSHGIIGRKQACDIYFQKSCYLLNDAEFSYLLAVSQLGINPYTSSNQDKILSRALLLCNKLSKANIWNWWSWCSLLSIPNYISISFKDTSIDPRINLFLAHDEPTSSDHWKYFDQDIYLWIQSILTTTASLREQYNAKDCCIVILDKDAHLISMNICNARSDQNAGKINLCLQSRQTWSAIKPFLYLYAMIEHWLQANDIITDEPVQFDLGDGSMYEPKNFDLKYHGNVTLAYALGNSLNIPAIKLTHMVWVNNFFTFLKQQLTLYASGFDNNNQHATNLGLSLGLGTYEISPYAFTRLWTLFLQHNSSFIYQQSEILSILTNPNYKIASFGQDSFLYTPWRAVKTGTSRKFIDGRVCGIHSKKQLSMCIWLWNYNNDAMKGASSEVWGYLWQIISQSL